ncbi:CPBP family intramembrane glutamic endopeptidase [Lactovum odontotermitis]
MRFTNKTGSYDDSVWRPYFIIENFLFTPILEELIFRELFLKIFTPKKAWLYISCSSLVYPALCFMSFGFDLFLIFAVLSGLVFSALRWYSKDIKLPIVLHILLNLGGIFYE